MTKPLFDQGKSVATGQQAAQPRTTALVILSDADIEKVGGNKTGGGTAEFADKMMAQVKSSDLDEVGLKLTKLLSVAKSLDPSKLTEAKGFLDKLRGAVATKKDELMAKYQTAEQQMDALIREVDKTMIVSKARINDLETIYGQNVKMYESLKEDVATLERMAAELDAAVEQLQQSTIEDSFAAQQIDDVRKRADRARKKADDFQRMMLLCTQLAPQIRMMQENARLLVTKFDDTKKTAIPAWKSTFSLYIIQMEQKKAAELSNAIHDATNEAFKRQADMLRQNTQAIATATQRSVVDIETVRHVQTQLLGSLDDVARITEEGKRARDAARPEMQQLEQQLIERFAHGRSGG